MPHRQIRPFYDESRRNKMLAEGDQERIQKVFKKADWYDFVIRCSAARVQICLNGLLTVDYTEPDEKVARRGVIGLQVHGGKPAEAWYRAIRIQELPAAK